MKKLLIALLVVFLVAGVAAVGVGYYVYRQVRSTVEGFAELGRIPEIERGVRQRGFVPPASQELTESQVTRFMRVQSQVRHRIGERFADFERKYKTLVEKDQASLSDMPSVVAAYRDMAALWLEAKRTQVDALNEAGFSLDEYGWIRDQAYRALGLPYVDLDLARLIESAGDAGHAAAGQLRGAVGAMGPEKNRALVESFKKQLEENVALASLGL
jgi:hypothetical protein